MFNVQTNLVRLFLSTAAVLSLSAVTACGPTAEEKAAEERKNLGETLFAEIEKASKSGEYLKVIELCDSLDKSCPDQTQLREKALYAWTDARYHVLQDSAAFLDIQLDSLTAKMTALMPDFVKMEISSGLDSYRVVKSVTGGAPLVSRTGVEPRLGGEDDLWTLVVNVYGSKPSIKGLRLTTADGVAIETLADNADERRATETAGEMLSFKAEEAVPIAEALSHTDISGAKIEILGSSKAIPVTLTKPLAEAIIETWEMATLREQRQALLKKRELTSRKIQLAESQRNSLQNK